ncbi:hypothetical protein DEO72_LG4g1031 [Vigna unguiculata]|uniref:Uncharacterized protein n=1 Tax=Vigna unguiculata TaxID=3917 RepID=A0A4D6LND6_VIGUN|nr:hypothetical protein DEO72_LG4g1031 [Vigna unguiculata]
MGNSSSSSTSNVWGKQNPSMSCCGGGGCRSITGTPTCYCGEKIEERGSTSTVVIEDKGCGDVKNEEKVSGSVKIEERVVCIVTNEARAGGTIDSQQMGQLAAWQKKWLLI